MTVAVERQSPSFNIPRAHHHHHIRHKPPHARVLMFFLRHLFRVDGQRAAQERCLASQRATTALVVATRAAVDRHGPGICDASQRAAARRSTLHEDSHQGRGGGGLRAAPRLTGTEDSTSGTRLAPLPQGWAVAFQCPVAGVPSLSMPVLAGRAGRAGGLLLPPLPHGFCVGGQEEGGRGGERCRRTWMPPSCGTRCWSRRLPPLAAPIALGNLDLYEPSVSGRRLSAGFDSGYCSHASLWCSPLHVVGFWTTPSRLP